MGIWIAQILSIKILNLLPAITLIIIGLISEKYYVGRIAILSNAVALATYFYPIEIPVWLIWYINIITVAGILALISYLTKISLFKEFYFITGLFSSLISGGLLLYWGLIL